MDINYEKIGQRIKRFRLQKKMPQEKLAELTGLSTPHMSHIETGSTKLGLPTIVKIANVLEVSEIRALVDIAKAAKAAIRRGTF